MRRRLIYRSHISFEHSLLGSVYTWRTLTCINLKNNWTQQLPSSATKTPSRNHTKRKAPRPRPPYKTLWSTRFYARTLSKMNKLQSLTKQTQSENPTPSAALAQHPYHTTKKMPAQSTGPSCHSTPRRQVHAKCRPGLILRKVKCKLSIIWASKSKIAKQNRT